MNKQFLYDILKEVSVSGYEEPVQEVLCDICIAQQKWQMKKMWKVVLN